MSEPLPHLDHRVSLFTKSDLLFLIVLLLLAVMALHYQGAVWQHARQVGANDSTDLVLVLDWPIWSQPAIDGIIWFGLAIVLGLTLLCVLLRWVKPIRAIMIGLLLVIAARTLPAQPDLIESQAFASDQSAYQSAIKAFLGGDYATALTKFERVNHYSSSSVSRVEAVGWESGARYHQQDYVASVAAACEYMRQATPSQRNWASNLITLHWAISRLGQASSSLDAAIQQLDNIAACQSIPQASHYWLAISPGMYIINAETNTGYTGGWVDSAAARLALSALLQRYPAENDADFAWLCLGEYGQLIQQFPNSDWLDRAYYGRAFLDDQRHDSDQARTDYQAFIDRFPQHAFAQKASVRVGHILEEQQDFAGALMYFLQISPTRSTSGLLASNFTGPYAKDILYLLDVEMTADDIQQFIGQHPKLPAQNLLRFSQAANLMAEDRYDEARDIFQDLMGTLPTTALLHGLSQDNLMKIYTIQGQLTSSAPDAQLNLALYLLQDKPVFYNELWASARHATLENRGAPWSYYQQHNDHLRAITLLQQLLEQHPDDPRAEEALFNLGQAYDTLGNTSSFLPAKTPTGYDLHGLRQKAVDAYQTLLQKYPASKHFDAVLAETGLIYLANSPIELEPAIQQFRALAQRYPDRPFTSNALNWVAYLECTQATLEEPGTATWQDKFARSQADYQTILDKYPDGHIGRTAQQNLRNIQAALNRPGYWSKRGTCLRDVP